MRSKDHDDSSRQAAFLDALRSTKAVSGSTHTYYRYPARFSPEFAREAINLFTKLGDTVLDPFMGGGTSAVEAISSGRQFIGSDINQLAYFVARVKTTVLSRDDIKRIHLWASDAAESVDLLRNEHKDPPWQGYKNNLPWRMRRVLTHLLDSVDELRSSRQRQFARCSILSTAQWALDCKAHIPGKNAILSAHERIVRDMLAGNKDLRKQVKAVRGTVRGLPCRLYCADASLLHKKKGILSLGRPKLVLTSPPYLGVHVLYHRWQILGRRETSAPYWIVNKPDGHGGSFYTFADRKAAAHKRYMIKLRACFDSIRALMDQRTLVVQLVAFPDADIQLPVYLRALAEVGLQHCESIDTTLNQSTLARDVPNRKWYALLNKQSHSSREFLLIHRRGKPSSRHP